MATTTTATTTTIARPLPTTPPNTAVCSATTSVCSPTELSLAPNLSSSNSSLHSTATALKNMPAIPVTDLPATPLGTLPAPAASQRRPSIGGSTTGFHGLSFTVPGKAARDHLALERTYLAYHRTSLVLSLLSILVLQLQVLQHAPHPSPSWGFYILGKPLAATLGVCALLTSLLGVSRWKRWERSLMRGEAMVGGGEMVGVGVLVAIGIGAVGVVAIGASVGKMVTEM